MKKKAVKVAKSAAIIGASTAAGVIGASAVSKLLLSKEISGMAISAATKSAARLSGKAATSAAKFIFDNTYFSETGYSEKATEEFNDYDIDFYFRHPKSR